ncbi:winged helix DNA-binding domain-containing protein [Pseudonocardia spirodelae]|uniref:Winged helix DNA-binding domain-containing protein n=1 Tax=Pseudonocardia spirodelae TaxID=3133431 RepID=A0ABU8T864_9PSEU
MRVLTADDALRALLARQLLTGRVATTVPRALERLCGLQTQHAPSGYLGLHARLEGFDRAALTAMLHDGRVVQAWAMRSTIHMLSARDHPRFTAAVRDEQRADWLRLRRDVTGADMAAAAGVVAGAVAAGPRRQADLTAELAAHGLPAGTWPGVQHWTGLVRVPPAGTWDTPRAHVYGPAGTREPTPEDRCELARRYLRAFGPATAPDVARFAGWPVAVARAALGELTLRRFTGEDGAELLDVPRAPLPGPGTPLPVRFLGPFDAVLLLGHAARARIVPAAHRAHVFATTKPRSAPTFLLHGRVAGTWERRGQRVVTSPFTALDAADARAVAEEGERLAAWHPAP